ncbi:MAG: STAS domain-containing protein [Desulfobacteraceae bacterium]|nr:MAG: STAS domain-containing protein [Desulfobacteraceae bacterium]
MPIDIQTLENRSHCRISGVVNIWEAADIWRVLYPLICSPGPLRIDLAGIEACDGAGLQIVCQLQRLAGARAGGVRLEGAPEALLEVMREAGLDARALADLTAEA